MDGPRDADVDDANARLTDSLKSCRTIVSNYRALIAGDDDGALPPVQPESPEADADTIRSGW